MAILKGLGRELIIVSFQNPIYFPAIIDANQYTPQSGLYKKEIIQTRQVSHQQPAEKPLDIARRLNIGKMVAAYTRPWLTPGMRLIPGPPLTVARSQKFPIHFERKILQITEKFVHCFRSFGKEIFYNETNFTTQQIEFQSKLSLKKKKITKTVSWALLDKIGACSATKIPRL